MLSFRSYRTVCTALGMLLLLWVGCHRPVVDDRLRPLAVPADFTLVFHIEGHGRAHQPSGYTSQYIIEPDRKLRVALGAGVTVDYFPSVTSVLSAEQFKSVYEHVRENHLLAEPASPAARMTPDGDEAAVVYDVAITCNGRTQHYRTTPEDSPATVQLIFMMIKLRRPILPVPASPESGEVPRD